MSGGSNVSEPSSARSSGAHRHVDALRMVQRVGDRHAHVRDGRGGRASAPSQSCDERVDDRLRVHDDVDPVVRRAEQVVGLDHLEALVHQRRRVDRDLAAHRPGRVLERLLDRHVVAARPARGRGTGRRRRSATSLSTAPGRARRRSAGAAPSARSRPGSAARRSPRRAPSRARRRRPATPCWRARGRCPRSARRSSGRARPSRRSRSARGRRRDSATSRTRPSGPRSTSPSVHASAARAAASRSESAIRVDAVRARLLDQRLVRAAGGQADDLELAAARATTSSAWVPIEPVEPRMRSRFIRRPIVATLS